MSGLDQGTDGWMSARPPGRLNAAGRPVHPDAIGPAGVYHPALWLPASSISLRQFRQILLWPLALDLPEGGDVSSLVKKVEAELRAAPEWAEVKDLLAHADLSEQQDPERRSAYQYAEFVYFYDFLQRILFCNTHTQADPPFRLFQRTNVVGVEFEAGSVFYNARIARLNLYVFASGAAVLVTELDFGWNPKVRHEGIESSMTLADAQTAIDLLRRAYAPYFWLDGDRRPHPGRVTDRIRWLHAGGGTTDHLPESLDDAIAFVRAARTPPVFEHWRSVLSPLVLAGYGEGSPDTPIWRHIVDERMPTMSFISVTDAGNALHADVQATGGDLPPTHRDLLTISRGDWVRLQDAEIAGTDEMPYSPGFFEDFEKDCCYDRYWPHPAIDGDTASRFLFSGYHFAIVGAGNFFDTRIVEHFRRHYFQMMLLTNMELASLLATSSRISAAVAVLPADRKDRGPFRDAISAIQGDFLDFVHRFRFTGVSNQAQPTELFGRLRKAMRLDVLYEDVKAELEAAVQFNTSEVEFDLSKAGAKLADAGNQAADASNRLAAIAAVVASLGLAFTLVGSYFEQLTAEKLSLAAGDPIGQLLWDATVFGAVCAFFSAGTLWLLQHVAAHGVSSHEMRAVRIIRGLTVAFTIFSAISILLMGARNFL